MRFLAPAGIGLAMATSACTTTLNTSIPATGISRGYSYQLPRLGYEAKVTRTLVACPETPSQTVRFDITSQVSSRLSRGDTIVVDYLAASSSTKTADFTMKSHPNGMLKSINLTVNDQSADLVKEGVKSIVGIGKIVIGLPSGAATAAGGTDEIKSYLRCSEGTQKTLAGLPSLKAAAKTADEELKTAQKNLSDLEAASKTGKPAKAEKLAELAKTVRDKTEAKEKASKAVEDAVSSLTLVQTRTIELPNAGLETVLDLASADAAKIKPPQLLEIYKPTDGKKAFRLPLDQKLEPNLDAAQPVGYSGDAEGVAAVKAHKEKLKTEVSTALANGEPSPYVELLAQLENADVSLIAKPIAGDPTTVELPVAKACNNTKDDCGIVYRAPAPGRVRMCTGRSIDACKARVTGDSAILFQEERAIPQFGRLASLPLINGPFMNNTLSAEFAEDGQILEMSYKQPTSAAVAAVGALNEGIGGATELITYKKGRELQKLKEKKALYEAQLATQKARDDLTPSELENLQDQKALVEAQIELAEAQTRAQPSQVTAVENETLLIDARKTQIEAMIELKKAEKALADLDKPTPAPAPTP